MATRSNNAQARLEFAIRRAEEAGDMYGWMIGVSARYNHAKQRGASQQELAELRRGLRDHAELFRAQFRSRAGRLWVAQYVEATIGPLFADELSHTEMDTAGIFEMMEAVKSRMLLDQMSLGFKRLSDDDVRRETTDLERQMLGFEEDEDQDSVTSEIRLTSRLPVGNQWEPAKHSEPLAEIERRYKASNLGFEGVQAVSALSEVRSALAPNEALIEYFIPYHGLHPAFELYVMAITADEILWIPVSLESLPMTGLIGSLSVDGRQPLDSSPLGELVLRTRLAIQNGEDSKANSCLTSLYQLLIDPLLQRGLHPKDFHRWIIIPHRMLHPVPWVALQNQEGRRLIEDVALTFAPSASIWLKLIAPFLPAPTSFLGMANPTLPYSDLPSLPEAEQEVKDIEPSLKSLDSATLVRGAATETALRKQVAGKSIIHLATHGAFPEQDPLSFHKILLSPTYLDDGKLNAEELREMDFRSAQLVVLSICNGGIYRFGPGDEPYGMISALLTAGARNLVGTLWRIEDIKGRRFMVDFYVHLLECGPAEALRRTACKLIQSEVSLRDWAAFLVAGPGRPFPSTPR